MPLIDFTKKDTFGNPAVIDHKGVHQAVPDEVNEPTPADWSPPADEVPPPSIDPATAPDGRYGIDKIHAWLHDQGLSTDPDATKKELLAAVKELLSDQEES